MIFQDFHPRPELREYVACYHLRHFVFQPGEVLPFKPYPPRPEQCLTFFPREGQRVEYPAAQRWVAQPRAVLVGQATQRVNLHVGRDFLALIVVFRPGALFRLTGLPAGELTGTHVDAESVFSPDVRRLSEHLSSSTDYDEMIRLVEGFLLAVAHRGRRPALPVDRIASGVVEFPGAPSVVDLAGRSCLSPRQLERQCRERLGVGPKTFARIARLHHAYRRRFHCPQEDWLSTALACGYYDLQHLAKDFRDLAGASPTTLFQQDERAPERAFGWQES
ncbi:AraC family transcriptional regulator [Hymenobacter busanensis]|uniref:AraC family transcriptional regulator n=1 Tax=Hymenobacter busanensis TaxID=2607656 RepID=A0A7L4ZSA2_9BACT|nr:helix-turn-helix domain-containing protein [Hymenobacter busanensis]KAA9327722.1 AraC family transcriptional regulator [Hymenobacter busanensis]QHJ05938.1 helix-turn-helix domain-containing protein [Hymenobacter busanensis]